MDEACLLCSADRLTDWHLDDADCWVADCIVCMTPMIVWRIHGLPDPQLERTLLGRLEQVATERYGDGGFWVDPERRRIPDHWHAHARPAGGFFDPRSTLFERWEEGEAQVGGDPASADGSSAEAGSPPSPGKINE
jgi:hypothetical protein